MDVGERLQSIRKLKGLSQRELAKRAGVTSQHHFDDRKNSVSPSISSLRKVLGGIYVDGRVFLKRSSRKYRHKSSIKPMS